MSDLRVELHLGDCLEVMKSLPAGSVEAVVTDPPYGLSFMGKDWDHGTPGPAFWGEALRVAKSGAHLLAFGGTRTFHRLAVAIEDAGWEIRDTVMWVYGFPKSLDVSKAIDKAAFMDWLAAHPKKAAKYEEQMRQAGGDHKAREHVLRKWRKAAGAERQAVQRDPNWRARVHSDSIYEGGQERPQFITAPATDAARQWSGWGTALKPAWEPVIVARKSLEGTVAENVLRYGTGAINVDGCRVEPTGESRARADEASKDRRYAERGSTNFAVAPGVRGGDPAGRWPANLIHDGSEEVVLLFPQTTSGKQAAGGHVRNSDKHRNAYAAFKGERCEGDVLFGDSGSAARFFYCAKASRADRNEGCEAMPERPMLWSSGTQSPGTFQAEGTKKAAQNNHPTVKPTDLMRYLCRLVTPAGGVVLDPFMGSGSTGKAAMLEGFGFLGIEIDPGYFEIAKERIEAARLQMRLPMTVDV